MNQEIKPGDIVKFINLSLTYKGVYHLKIGNLARIVGKLDSGVYKVEPLIENKVLDSMGRKTINLVRTRFEKI